MNTANLQLEGLYAVIAELIATLQAKNLMTTEETEAMLRRAEKTAGEDAERRGGLSPAEFEGVLFPIRLLMEANRGSERDERLGFSDLARLVGQMKPLRPGVRSSRESFALAFETERERDA
jgi:hypothetical protein